MKVKCIKSTVGYFTEGKFYGLGSSDYYNTICDDDGTVWLADDDGINKEIYSVKSVGATLALFVEV